MADAMSADEHPSPPRKTSWKRWTLALTTLLAVALAALFLKAPREEPVTLRFVGTTNYDAGQGVQKVFVLRVTNALPRKVRLYAFATYKFVDWDRPETITDPYYERYVEHIAAGGTRTILVRPIQDGTDTYVMWQFEEQDVEKTRMGKARMACYNFLWKHGIKRLPYLFSNWSHPHYLSPADLKE